MPFKKNFAARNRLQSITKSVTDSQGGVQTFFSVNSPVYSCKNLN